MKDRWQFYQLLFVRVPIVTQKDNFRCKEARETWQIVDNYQIASTCIIPGTNYYEYQLAAGLLSVQESERNVWQIVGIFEYFAEDSQKHKETEILRFYEYDPPSSLAKVQSSTVLIVIVPGWC